MKYAVRNVLTAIIGVALGGCEWGGGGGGDSGSSWNSRYNFANFSGSYSGNGGYLVSEYTVSGSSSGSSGEINVVNEDQGPIPATSYGGDCNRTPIKPGSVHVFISDGVDGQMTDDGGGNLAGTFNIGGGVMVAASGTINYDNGAYGIILGPSAAGVIGKRTTITYTVISSGSGSTTASSSPGSSGIEIIAFNVQQDGNVFTIVDNNGSVYEGRIGNITTTGGTSQDSGSATFNNGDQVMASFEAKGTSAAGIDVEMTGNFQATINGVSSSTDNGTTTTRMVLTNRRILGTWIESGGKTGNISGAASDISTTASSTSTGG